MLDRIRFAAVNRLCVELDYRKENGRQQHYVIEPYSLRATAEGNTLLYGVKLPTDETRAFRIDRIVAVNITRQAFTPRYSIDFIPTGPVELSGGQFSAESPVSPRGLRRPPRPKAPRPRKRSSGLKYVFRCTVCGKTFSKSSHHATLNPHKNKRGSPCNGRVGTFIKTRHPT